METGGVDQKLGSPYAYVTCGGDNKERDKQIADEASWRAAVELEHHPCGCEFCVSNLLLYNLFQVRLEQGVDPHTGKTL